MTGRPKIRKCVVCGVVLEGKRTVCCNREKCNKRYRKERRRRYYLENREEYLRQMKIYTQIHREQIRAQQNERNRLKREVKQEIDKRTRKIGLAQFLQYYAIYQMYRNGLKYIDRNGIARKKFLSREKIAGLFKISKQSVDKAITIIFDLICTKKNCMLQKYYKEPILEGNF